MKITRHCCVIEANISFFPSIFLFLFFALEDVQMAVVGEQSFLKPNISVQLTLN